MFVLWVCLCLCCVGVLLCLYVCVCVLSAYIVCSVCSVYERRVKSLGSLVTSAWEAAAGGGKLAEGAWLSGRALMQEVPEG